MTEKSPFVRVDQVGVVVNDLEKAVDYYESLGIGPFALLTGIVSAKRWVDGKPIDPASIKLKVSIAKVGAVDFELIEPGEGKSLWRDFLETKGEGINHMGFFIDDIEKEQAELEAKGIKAVYASRFDGGGGAAYFATDEVGGVLFELIQWPPK